MARGEKPFHSIDFFISEKDGASDEWKAATSPGGKFPLPKTPELPTLKLWSDERQFMEDTVYKRFTFLLTILGATIAGLFTIRDALPSCLLLVLSLIACRTVTASIHRTYAKTCFLAAVLVTYKFPPLEVMAFHFEKKSDRFRGAETFSRVGRIGPNFVVALLLVGVVWSAVGIGQPDIWLHSAAPISGRDGRDGPPGQQGAPGLKGDRGPAGTNGRDLVLQPKSHK